jgi:hypothetical protein
LGAEWLSQDRGGNIYYKFTNAVPGGSNGWFADRVAEAGQKWNAIPIGGPDFHFVRNGTTPNFNPHPCPAPENAIHYRNISDGFSALTETCIVWVGQDYIATFQVTFDPDVNWYKGPDPSGIAGNEVDLEGGASHEFGHVVGGWTKSTPYQHFDPGVNPSLCFNPGGPWGQHHDMCAVWPVGKTVLRTLEGHDIDTLQTAYA